VMTQFDLAAAEIFAQSSDRVNQTFERIYARVSGALDGLSAYAHDTWDFDSNGAMMGDSVYLEDPQEKKARGWYAAWGIRFPAKSQWWIELGAALPATNHAYVCIVVDRKGFPGFRKLTSLIPSGWAESSTGEELVVGQPLSAFPSTSDEMTDAVGDWIAAKINEVKPALLEIRSKKW
jgi:hypothetical protein